MTTYVITESSEMVVISNGVLSCQNLLRNWQTIGEWMEAEWYNTDFKASIKVDSGTIYVELPDETQVATLGSLLEAFEYQ
jgi:hypothetical protein